MNRPPELSDATKHLVRWIQDENASAIRAMIALAKLGVIPDAVNDGRQRHADDLSRPGLW